MKEIRNRLALLPFTLSLIAGLAIPVTAQTGTSTTTTTTTATCTTAPTSITTLSLESVLTLSDVLTTLTPNIPSNLLASIAGGAQEIRSRLIYNPQQNTLTNTVFLVAAGSPNPTPLSTNVGPATILSFVINVSQIYTSCKPTPSVLMVGTISSVPNAAFGDFTGAPAAVSFGYTTDTTPVINNVVEVVAGQAVAYSAASTDVSFTFPAAPVTPPGSGTGNPTIVLNPAPPTSGSVQVFASPYYIDASGSTDPSKLPLTYSWTSNPPANFTPGANVPNPTIYFVSGQSDYSITLTVTDSAGNKSTQTFTLEYLGR